MKQNPQKPVSQIHFPHLQRGAVALATGLILLLLATAGTFYVSRSSVVDQRISSNINRTKAAFEAAEAGLNFATRFMDVDARDLNSNGTDDRIDMLTNLGITDSSGPGGVDDMDDGYGREFDDGTGYRLQAVWDNTNAKYIWSLPSSAGSCDLTAGTPAVNVRICLLITQGSPITRVNVTSTGYSDDRLGVKEVTQVYRRIAPSPGNLNASHALITYGGVAVSGSMTVVNVYSNATIWSGSDVTSFGGTNSGTFIHSDPEGPTNYSDPTSGDLVPFFDTNSNRTYDSGADNLFLDYSENANSSTYDTSIMTKSSGIFDHTVMLGVDIIDNSSGLRCDKTADPDCFFNNFIAGPPEYAKMEADYIVTEGESGSDRLVDPDAQYSIPGSFIWVDARNSDGTLSEFSLKNETYGTADEPIILVIDGDFDPSGSWRIYGVVYVRGAITGGGSGGGLLVGSLIVEGDNGVDGSGGMDIIYDPNVIGRSGGGDGRISAIPISGTWRDWVYD